ncbi:unnamed protein product [Eruca vesicaria subsp. sativa]|uniref:Uncharacterized protein n=1 Tax=Eruca vesicaria subsp. sativa TaxID=29727 RepID=A0ABC8IWY4_ERUVS|nr:unnamed protein product [Eruca vesicaria subsp. sativa]
MDDDMWAVSSSGSSRSLRSATTAKYQSGTYLDSGDFEEEEDDDVEVDYACPSARMIMI